MHKCRLPLNGTAQQVYLCVAVDEGVQYNTARTLRHLALGTQATHKAAAMPAIVPLTRGLQVTPTSNAAQAYCLVASLPSALYIFFSDH